MKIIAGSILMGASLVAGCLTRFQIIEHSSLTNPFIDTTSFNIGGFLSWVFLLTGIVLLAWGILETRKKTIS